MRVPLTLLLATLVVLTLTSACGDDDAVVPAAPVLAHLKARDFEFQPTTLEVTNPQPPIAIEIANTGAQPHTFTIDALGIDIDLTPGDTTYVQIPEAGDYAFYCRIHPNRMTGTLTFTQTTASP